MIQALKKMFSKGSCEKCGWLMACPECSERMRQVDRELTIIERAHARRKESRYGNKEWFFAGRFDGMVDKNSFMEVLHQVLSEQQGESTGNLMLTVTLATPAITDDPSDWQLVLREVAQRIVSQLRHEDFVTSFDDQTFALLLVDSGEEPLQFEGLAQRVKVCLAQPLVFSDQQIELDYRIRNISLQPGTTLDHIRQQMDS